VRPYAMCRAHARTIPCGVALLARVGGRAQPWRLEPGISLLLLMPLVLRASVLGAAKREYDRHHSGRRVPIGAQLSYPGG
jgi:hypothetical protein